MSMALQGSQMNRSVLGVEQSLLPTELRWHTVRVCALGAWREITE